MTFADLRQKIKQTYGSKFNCDLVERAYRFAEEAHRDEKRKSGEPFISHPVAVANLLVARRLDAATIAAAILHDVAESAPYTKADIERAFGSEVASLVEGVTKLKNIRYTAARLKNEHIENLRKMVFAFAKDIRVVLIKLMDRLHNMETISFLKPDAQQRIALETLEIYAPLANRLGMGELKGQLEDLSFPVAYPDEWRELHSRVTEPLEERRKFISRLIPTLRQLLEDNHIPILDMHARAKHWYSLWKKLERYEGNLERVYDLAAVRLIVSSIEHCYAALGVIHSAWPPLPGRIKDFIALPKPNGYRSLHTTIVGPEGKITEMQIRTLDMHHEDEEGIAAHWTYKEDRHTKHTLQKTKALTWVKQLRDWMKQFHDERELLESLRIDFFKDRIFVFTPKGEVIDLPQDSTPIDFAYHIHSDIGDHAMGAKVNGKMTALSTDLQNGDMVEILTQKAKKPSAKWLGFVKTSVARRHIQAAVRKR
ncbi:bifunctional (p)ppGpp synthetase/guanosine-3',5'-bis(diphosphate) 3'-pyrophosphohydrolase [Candidatus Parcubacteria bacterium]|nr:bifunctional (p)ppGpp synthetase/guanosine-3',5'-bis(diphosphate) 3'-pyrophosphohydrolase [Candidatus Parcubacteria bacterium]